MRPSGRSSTRTSMRPSPAVVMRESYLCRRELANKDAQVTPASGLAEALVPRIATAARKPSSFTGRVQPLTVGVTGPQGSGKTTLAAGMAPLLEEGGLRTVVLSLDDIYLSKAARQRLAATVHPLFATRGVPGTPDV